MKALTTEQLLPLVKTGTPDAFVPFLYFYTGIGEVGLTPIIHNGEGVASFVPMTPDSKKSPFIPCSFIYMSDYIGELAHEWNSMEGAE